MKTEWETNTIDERIAWYSSEIGSLLSYIEGREVISGVVAQNCVERLSIIRERLDIDREIAFSKQGIRDVDQYGKLYYHTVSEVYKILTDTDSNPSRWPLSLYKALDKLIRLKINID